MKYSVKVKGKTKFFKSLFEAKQYASGHSWDRPQLSQWTQGTWKAL